MLPSDDEILSCLRRLPEKLSAGVDGIPCSIVRDCARCFILPLKLIAHSCLSKGVFPTVWKTSKVCPIHKTGDKSLIVNYRPITLISAFARVIEMLLYDLILPHFSHTISSSQHGFVSKRSTVTNLLPYTQFIYDKITMGEQVDVIETDFSKAFDKVDICLLIRKLKMLNLPEKIINLLTSYLLGRKNIVIFNGYCSREFISTSGVPQGSKLGPLLFLIFINQIGDILPIFLELFADDTKFYMGIKSYSDCQFLQ
ncbi:GSCOCG00012985001-RA-CDS, partial [Cotesia congregata]